MADVVGGVEPRSPNLNLSAEEQRLFTQVFSAADSEGIGVVTGDVALRFLPERTRLPSEVLGEIWQAADTEDKGFLTPSGFYVVLRLIGYAQAGRPISAGLGTKPGGPLPHIEGINANPPAVPASPLQAQGSGGPVKVPPLAPDKASQYAMLFQQSGAQDGLLPGATAKQIFDRAQLPNDILVRIWNLADTEQRGKLSLTEFIIAMHLLASYRTGAMRTLPQNLPAGLWDAAARRNVNQRPPSSGGPVTTTIPRQISGPTTPRTSSPLASRPPYPTPQTQMQAQSTGDWAISPQEKAQYDTQFAKLDPQGRGFLTGEQAVTFFGNSRLAEDDLAQIWDLADTQSRGQLDPEEFAIAMHLIRNQLQGRGPIPKTLPPSLSPPSARQARPGSAQPPVPQSVPKPKSAAEDLFGLDALSDPPPAVQAPQSTGGSSAIQPLQPAPATSPKQQPQSTVFKPFVPTSSFGQSIASPQVTGTSAAGERPQKREVGDDLLGDADPEVSKKLTNDTTELANLSTQVGNLTNQMQDVKAKREVTENNLSTVTQQKKDFEGRLAQLRTAYEQEAREVRALEEKLNASRNETKKAQADLAMVQHSYNNLQEQKQQLSQALEADLKENASLKERMRDVNTEISQIKPQIEKIKSDARQQKGLVAIHKKQLLGNEAERDRQKSELDGATREYEDATRELEETKSNLDSQKNVPVPVASPTGSPSSQNTNPFFRRQTTESSERGMERSPLAPEGSTSPNHSAFDSFFGSTFPTAESTTQAPPVSFGAPVAQEEPETVAAAESEAKSTTSDSEEPRTPTQTMQHDIPPTSQLPPPPPQSRQITSSSLPFKDSLQRPASPSSSVGVAPPASRFGEGSGYTTPVRERQISQAGIASGAAPMSPLSQSHEAESSAESSPVAPPPAVTEVLAQGSRGPAHDNFGSENIPGSFPGDVTPPTGTASINGSAGGKATEPQESDDPFAMSGPPRSATAKDDFDSAFAGFENKDKALATAGQGAEIAPTNRSEEFPPIQEFGDESDSDSDSGKGFDDDFTIPAVAATGAAAATSTAAATSALRPENVRTASQTTSQLPTPNAEKSPPTYDQANPIKEKGRTGSNQFPPEYNGLLPSREEPTSPENVIASPVQQTSAGIAGIGSADATKGVRPPTPPPKAKARDEFADFENDFGDLSEAQVADDKAEDDFSTSRHADFNDEFNPTFDSPAPSKMTSSSMFGTDSNFDNFESNVSAPTHAAAAAPSAAPAAAAPNDSDWDNLFANLGKEGNNVIPTSNANGNLGAAADAAFGHAQPAGSAPTTAGEALKTPAERPDLARAVSDGTEHDDPILKRLTAMGYPRNTSLQALEKFDYNLDKAVDYLMQQ